MENTLEKTDKAIQSTKTALTSIDDAIDAISEQQKRKGQTDPVKVPETDDLGLAKPEEGPSKWEFEEGPLTINDCLRQYVSLKDLIGVDEVKFNIEWPTLIRLVNSKIKKGPKLTGNSPIGEAIDAYFEVFSKGFL